MNARPPRWFSPIAWTALHGIVGLVSILGVVWIVPRLERRFADFGISLSGSAILTIRLAQLLANLLPMILAALVVGLGIDFAVLRHLRRSRDERLLGWAWGIALLLLMFAPTAFAALSLVTPFWTLETALKG